MGEKKKKKKELEVKEMKEGEKETKKEKKKKKKEDPSLWQQPNSGQIVDPKVAAIVQSPVTEVNEEASFLHSSQLNPIAWNSPDSPARRLDRRRRSLSPKNPSPSQKYQLPTRPQVCLPRLNRPNPPR